MESMMKIHKTYRIIKEYKLKKCIKQVQTNIEINTQGT